MKPTSLDKAHHTPSSSQNFDKNFTSPNSYLENYLKSNATPNNNQNGHTPYALKPQINNFMSQTKSLPIKYDDYHRLSIKISGLLMKELKDLEVAIHRKLCFLFLSNSY